MFNHLYSSPPIEEVESGDMEIEQPTATSRSMKRSNIIVVLYSQSCAYTCIMVSCYRYLLSVALS